MKLYYYEFLNPRKACAAAKYLESPVEFVRVNVGKNAHKTPEFLAINPNGRIPALEDGDLRLWESNAIMCHLARKAGSPFWPKDGDAQIDAIRWLSWDGASFSLHGGALYFEFVIKPMFGIGPPDKALVADAQKRLRQSAQVLDDHLRDRDFLLGSMLTVADFAVAATLPYPEAVAEPLEGFANIARWHGRLNDLPAWRDPFPPAPAKVA